MTRSSFLIGAALLSPALVAAQVPARELAALGRLPWRSLGPTTNAGRVSVVAGVPGDPWTYFVAGANGGIIKTTNGGTTFRPVFDRQSVGSIGAIAVAPSDPNIVYAGTGEGNPRNNASVGDGIYKSVDAGEHWTRVGLERTDKIARLAIDPRNPDVVYACALGREWGANEERGVFKTIDGGRSWKRLLFIDAQTGCSDLSTAANNANIVYAGMYTYLRRAWHLESGAGQTSVWKSLDGGEHWTRLSGPDAARGLPKKAMDRIGVAVAPSDANVVYVVSETVDEGELWRSDDAGESWRMVNKDQNLSFRPFYYSDIRVDPANANRVWALSGSLYLSEDGGRTFTQVPGDVHGDHQAMWIDPLNAKRILEGSDGGWQVSNDGGKTWDVVNTFPFTQFYHVNVDMEKPYHICGGLQDNGNWCATTIGFGLRGVQRSDWYTVSYGDGFFTVPDVARPWLVYSDAQGGMISITDTRNGNIKTIYPYPNRVGSVGDRMLGHKYRFNWNAPIAVTPLQPGTVYFGGNVLFRSRDFGNSWDVISPDLTTNDPAKQQHSGGQIVTDNTAAEFHTTMLSISPSPVDSNVIWIGTDDGNVQVTRDGGKTWSNVFKNVPGLAPFAWIPTVEASRDPGTAYVVADHHQDDDYAPYLYMTTDYGKTWTSIVGDLPRSAGWGHVIREDPRNRNLLYFGSEMGLWASWDRGAHWLSLRGELPVVPVRDLQVHPRENDLIVATHGRGIYVLDDITPLQQLRPAMGTDVTLFDVRPATRWNFANREGNLGYRQWSGENPPYGALVQYFLRDSAKAVTLTVTDASGKVIRTMKEQPARAGVMRTAWDLRHDGPEGGTGPRRRTEQTAATRAEWHVYDRDVTLESFGTPAGPMVTAGRYTLTLDVDGKKSSKVVDVSLDPRYDLPASDVVAQETVGLELRDLTSRVNGVVDNTNSLLDQLTALQGTLKTAAERGAPEAKAQALVDSTVKELTHFRDSTLTRPAPVQGYRQYPRLREEITTVAGMVWRGTHAPTAGERLRAGELQQETSQAQGRLDAVIADKIARINALLGTLPRIQVAKPRVVS